MEEEIEVAADEAEEEVEDEDEDEDEDEIKIDPPARFHARQIVRDISPPPMSESGESWRISS